ncbi:MAG: PA2169 family four-helix-bundle protein [Sphingobacteriales bacterium]|nr:MAG: PA2169 family four-helix-bundle protein [Sphingobacteriales bacterium]
MKTNEEIIDDLKGLVKIINDGKEGYESAAETVDAGELKTLFYSLSIERATYEADLKSQIATHGGESENESGGLLGAIHRTWIDIKQAFTSNDNAAILEAITTGEKAALEKYDDLLAHYTDHAYHYNLLRKQRDGIQEALSKIEKLAIQYAD